MTTLGLGSNHVGGNKLPLVVLKYSCQVLKIDFSLATVNTDAVAIMAYLLSVGFMLAQMADGTTTLPRSGCLMAFMLSGAVVVDAPARSSTSTVERRPYSCATHTVASSALAKPVCGF